MKRIVLCVLFFLPFLAIAQSLNISWVNAVGSTGDQVVQSTVVDASGNVYIGGSFEGAVNFSPNETPTILTSVGLKDAYFAKFSNNGVLQWIRQLGSTDNDEVVALAVDASNVYIAGYFNGTIDFNPSVTVGNLTASGSNDIFYGKYTTSGGDLSWANAHGNTGNDAAIAIKVDASSFVYVTGYFSGTVDFDASGATNNKTSVGAEDIFLLKVSSVGAFGWVDTFGSTGGDIGLTVDADNSSVYVGGSYTGTIDLDPDLTANSNTANIGGDDGFFGKYNSSTGALVWWATVRSTGDDQVTSVALNGTNFYLGGIFSTSAADFYSNPGVVTKASNGGTDIFIAKYNGSGSLPVVTWLNTIGGTSDDRSNLLTIDASANVYTTGYFGDTVDFDPSGSSNTDLGSNGLNDIYVASYSSAGIIRFAKAMGSTSDEEGTTIAVDGSGSGNVYVGGYFQGTTGFDFNSSAQDKSSLGSWDAFVAKYAQSAFVPEPTAQPTNLQVVDLQSNQFTYDITAAPGVTGGYLHIYKVGSAPTALPVDGIEYSAGNVLSDGSIVKYSDAIAAGNFYGSLTAGTSYFIKVFSFNGSGILTNYLTTNPLSATITTTGGSLTTEPTAQPTGIVFGTTTSNSIAVSFTAASPVPAGYIAVRKAGAAPTTDPVDGTGYSVGAILGDGVVAYSGATASFTDSGLASNTTYFYKIYSFNGNTSTTNYLTSVAALSGSKATTTVTLALEPTTQPSVLVFGTVTANSIPVSFTAATPAPAGYIAVRKAGALPTTDPVDGNDYIAGTSLGDGVVVFSGNATSFTDASLASGTTYFYKIYSFNGSSTTTNYLLTAPLSGSKATVSSFATEPTAQPTGITFGTVTDTSIPVSFTAASPVPAGYIAIRKAGAASTTDPVDGTAYTTSATLGDGVVAYVGTATSFTDNGLTAGTTYFYKIYSLNGGSTTTNYLTTTPLAGNKATTNSGTLATEPTAQPTNLVFSNQSATGFDYVFTAATGSPAGYIVLRSSGSAVSAAPVDGTVYAIGDAIGNAFVRSTTAVGGTTYSASSLTASTTYHMAIFAFNGSGTSINYRQLTPLIGSTSTTPDPSTDTTPPVFGTNTTPTAVKTGETIKVSITITDDVAVTSAEIDYGESSSIDWTKLSDPMTKVAGNVWEYTIPAASVKELGVEYRITAYDAADNSKSTDVLGVAINADQNGLTVPFAGAGTAQTNYKIVSVPLALETRTVDNVFGDDLGKYGDKSAWRLFRYSGGKTNELSGSSSINPGEGYWLISSANASLDSGPGKTVGRISSPFTLNITQGFNQIGNPYVFNLLWADVKTASDGTNDNTNLGLGDLKVYGGGFSTGTVLKKYEGGFVMATTAGTMVFPAEKKAAAGRTEDKPKVPVQNAIDGSDWEVNFELSNGIQVMNFSGIGMNRKASEAYDSFDDFTLPRFMDFIELNHASKELFNLSYTKDIVPSAEEHTWEFNIESNTDEPVTMKWDNSFFGNNNKQLVLWDVSQQRAFDMRSIRQYIFNKSRSGHFKVYYGDEKYIKEKTAVDQLLFHDVFPNPATDKVTISFSVPAEDRVTIQVFDLLGRKVATVADGNFKPGYHEVNWNTQDDSGNVLTNGIYITQIKGLRSDQQKRLSINK